MISKLTISTSKSSLTCRHDRPNCEKSANCALRPLKKATTSTSNIDTDTNTDTDTDTATDTDANTDTDTANSYGNWYRN